MPKVVNLIGQQFGSLTVIREIKTEFNHRIWVCQCICGKECKVSTSKLNGGKVTHCGCKRIHLKKTVEDPIALCCYKESLPNNKHAEMELFLKVFSKIVRLVQQRRVQVDIKRLDLKELRSLYWKERESY